MYKIKLYVIYYVATNFLFCNAYKILVVSPHPTRSHGILGDGVVKNLLQEGHEVTLISPYTFMSASPNLRMIDVSANIKLQSEISSNYQSLLDEYQFEYHGAMIHSLILMMKFTVENENVQRLLNDPHEQFDAVIMTWCLTEILAGFSAIFNCPYIWVSTLDTHWFLLRLVDQPTSPAYTADYLSSILPPFTFWERVTQLWIQLQLQYFKYRYINEFEKEQYEKLFTPLVAKRGRKLPSYYDIQFNASLILGNSHAPMGKAVALPQNYKQVGGYHIEVRDEAKTLPENLRKLLDNATNGLIYFSMGSNLNSGIFQKDIVDSILKIFSELKQTILWKFDMDLPKTPDNVHIMKWAPQHSILAHPNTILFITHGGLLSSIEAIHFGIPIIGIPIVLDQFLNIAKAVDGGYGKKVEYSENIATELKSAIEEILKNSIYAEKAKELSFIYRDRPVPPGKELAHWVRHVIQTRGAPHLRSPALDVPFYQKFYLDLLILIIITLFAIVRLIKIIYNMCLLKIYMYFTYNINKVLKAESKRH